MSGRVFQNIVLQFKDAVDTEIGVIDAEGTVIACTELSEIGSHWSELVSSINDAEESVVPLAGKTFKTLSGWNGHFDFAVFAYGENEMSRAACSMAAVALNAAKSYYEEKYDKVSFIKNIISDNIMLSDLYIRAKELHVETELNRGVFLIRRLDERFEGLTVEAVQNIFPDRQTSFALSMGESDVVLIQQLGENVSTRDLEKTAQLIEETLRENGESTVVVGIGTVAAHLRDLAKSYKEAQIAIEVGKVFDTEKYVNKWPAKRHDHYLIPAGTVHCSGAGAMVLEISATPSIFTFKLWDWGRLGLDGLPRPINIGHGSKVIQWERQTEFVRHNLINQVEMIAEGDGWREERTGLHENEFIETRRHWFTDIVPHNTNGGVQVLNVIKGDELIVESPTNAFEPFIVHYAETFIIPACVGEYTIRPYGSSVGKYCGTIKAYVRFRQ